MTSELRRACHFQPRRANVQLRRVFRVQVNCFHHLLAVPSPPPTRMSCADIMEPPTKKRRFFVEEDPVQGQSFSAEASFPDELNALPDTAADAPSRLDSEDRANTSDNHSLECDSARNGFDPELFTSVVGEQLPVSTINTLQSICGDDVQRGRHNHSYFQSPF